MKWHTTLKADKFGAPAIVFPARKFKDGDEDCLTLNLFKPSIKTEMGGFPVMVYIHGGGFVSGSSREWGYKEACRKLVSHGVIVITINYRLGPFGKILIKLWQFTLLSKCDIGHTMKRVSTLLISLLICF